MNVQQYMKSFSILSRLFCIHVYADVIVQTGRKLGHIITEQRFHAQMLQLYA